MLRAVRSHSGGCGGVVLFLPVFCIMFLKNSQNGLRHLDIYMTEDLKRAAVCVCVLKTWEIPAPAPPPY